jgi:hypothetical protein
MVEKRQTGIAVQFSGAIEINGDADLRFVSVAFDARLTLGVIAHSHTHDIGVK